MFMRFAVAAVAGFALLTTVPALAASDVSNSGSAQNRLITSSTSIIASTQMTSILSSAITGGFGGDFISAGRDGASATQTAGLGQKGRAAGNGAEKFELWAKAAYTSTEYDKVGATYDGGIATGMIGGSMKFSDTFLAGLALGYERMDLDTGSLTGTGKMEADGFTIAPYLGVQLSPRWSLDVMAGYTDLSYDAKRANNTITGSFDARRLFAGANVTGRYPVGGGLFMSPGVGVIYLTEKQDGYVESTGGIVPEDTIELGRAHLGAKVSYPMGMIAPYLRARAEYDFVHPDAVAIGNGQTTGDERLGGQVGLGLDFIGSGPLTGMVEASYDSLGRSDLNTWTLSAKVRYQF